jgi:hypothetical protein
MKGDDPIKSLRMADRRVPVVVRRNARARRISIRVDTANDSIVLTLPTRGSLREGLRFMAEKSTWIERRVADLPPRVPFEAGAVVPVHGRDRVVRHGPVHGRVVELTAEVVRVPGPPIRLPDRLEGWLREEARRAVGRLARDMAARIHRPIRRISVRDTRSRWGSCSANGNLSFCWRLVLAPPSVLRYVVAHEVAHLAEMNHGPRFWRLVRFLAGEDIDTPQEWLRRHGPALHRYG